MSYMNTPTVAKTLLYTACTVALLLLYPASLHCGVEDSQIQGLKDGALDAYGAADYKGALELLGQALELDDRDAQIWFYLGWFYHYLCYDSVPLSGFDLDDSDKVLEYLTKAIELDPSLGNAFYFLGAEYGGRSRLHLMDGDLKKAISELKKGREVGGYPDWLLEYGRNTLRSCDKDAILFLGGDADANSVAYVQLVEGLRKDVTAIPEPLLNRPWFISMIKRGVEGAFAPVPISWSEFQVSNMHSYKWKANNIGCEIPRDIAGKYGVDKREFSWLLEPDQGEGGLSVSGAALADIIITNGWKRSVHFTLGCHRGMFHGLDGYLQLCGTTYRLVPVEVEAAGFGIDEIRTREVLMEPGNLKHLPTVLDSDMPRISGILQNYRVVLFRLAYSLYGEGDFENARIVLEYMRDAIPEVVVPPGALKGNLEGFEKLLDQQKE